MQLILGDSDGDGGVALGACAWPVTAGATVKVGHFFFTLRGGTFHSVNRHTQKKTTRLLECHWLVSDGALLDLGCGSSSGT